MPQHAPYQKLVRLEIKNICQKMVDGDMSFIEGAREIVAHASDAALSEADPDLSVFVAVASETDDVPDARVLKLWNSDAIVKNTPYWTASENWAKEYGRLACRNLLLKL